MTKCLFLIAALVSSTASAAQTPTLQTGTQLVIVDVIVQDRSGDPVHGLKVTDFVVTEKHTAQTLRNAEEHSAGGLSSFAPPMPALPPGTFTDYVPVIPGSALNVLLLDTLNTPTKDQSFVRAQLQKYVNHAPAGMRMAIFGLSTHLTILQGFTADPNVLKDAVAHKLIPRSSALLTDPAGTNVNAPTLSDQMSDLASSSPSSGASLAQVAANLAQFEAEFTSYQNNLRTQYTLDAFNTLAHYLAGFPGRKNVLWFSGAFPLDVLPDPSLKNPFGVEQNNESEFRQTVTLLGKSEVSLYPIDARGLMTSPVFDAANSQNYTRDNKRFASDIAKFNDSQADEHSVMTRLAEETGGRAFYNTNGLADAVSQAVQSGANYYTLSYTPADLKPDGSYHPIHVTLSGSAALRGLKLAYRQGYYADLPSLNAASMRATTPVDEDTARQHAEAAYAHAAMARGAPTPLDLLFKVRVLPASVDTEPEVASGNILDPNRKEAGPFRRFDVDFAALPSALAMTAQPDGKHIGGVEFRAYVYDVSGRLLNLMTKTVQLNLPPDVYQTFLRSALQFHLEISAPVRKETYLRIAMRDTATNKFGVVEIPTSSVERLPPPVYLPPAATTPSTPAAPVSH